MTMNSVEPTPTSPLVMKSMNATFPFSRQGVIRAMTVQPFVKRVPDFGSRQDHCRTLAELVGTAAISRYTAPEGDGGGSVGLKLISSEAAIEFAESGSTSIFSS